jgi:hypothetical protein
MTLWLFFLLLAPDMLYASVSENVISPPLIPNVDSLPPTLASSPIKSILLGGLEVTFEVTNLDELQKAANIGKIYRRGDAGGSERWLCYTDMSQNQPVRIWFSSSELGGSDETITGFYAIAGDMRLKPEVSCPLLPAKLHPVRLSNKLWLGSNPKALKELIGKPSVTIGDWQFYSYLGKVLIKHADPYYNKKTVEEYDRSATLAVRVKSNKIIEMCEFQATTN